MKKKKIVFTLLSVFCCSLPVIYLKGNDSRATNRAVNETQQQEKKEAKMAIHADKADVSFNEAVLQSDAVVKVKILGKDAHVNDEIKGSIPKTIHKASVLESYNGKLKIGDTIKIMQEGNESVLINGMPLFEPEDTFIFMLSSAMPAEQFPNTYFIKKEYQLSNTTSQALDLNLGDANFEDAGALQDKELEKKLAVISEDMFVDEVNIQVIDTQKLVTSIEEVIKNEKISVLFSITIFGLISLFFTSNVEAHRLYQPIGSESVGYIVGPEHPAKKDIDYAFESGVSNEIIDAVRDGAAQWRDLHGVRIEERSQYNSSNLMKEYYDPNSTTIAYNGLLVDPTTRYFIQFGLNFNMYQMNQFSTLRKHQIAMHEWGHTFGLKDLYWPVNIDKVMYGIGTRMQATAITQQDYEGMFYGVQ